MATRKTTTRKKTAEKPAFVIDEDIEVGMLELPDSKGIRVALIRSAGKRYVAINRMYKSKTEGVWKHRNAIWLPYDKSYNIAGLIKLAYIEGLKRHWDQPYEEPAATPTSREDIQAAITETQAALEHLKHCLKQDEQEANIDQQLSLFEKLKKSMQ